MAETLPYIVTAENRANIGYKGYKDEVLNIPGYFTDFNTWTNYHLEEIGADCFKDCTNLKSVTIPEPATAIRAGAFNGCTGLTAVEIPATVTDIEANAFANVSPEYKVTFRGTKQQWDAITKDPSSGLPLDDTNVDFKPDIEQVIYEFLNREGVSQLSKALLTKVNTRIEERIVQTVSAESDEHHVASAKAVYTALQNISHLQFKTHTGLIEEVVDPQPNYIYLQRDNAEDTTWTMYVHDEVEGWLAIGDTTVNLSNYWSKDPEDIEALKLALGLTQDFDELTSKVAQLESDVKQIKTDVENVSTTVENKVDPEQLVALSEELISSAVDAAFSETAPSI